MIAMGKLHTNFASRDIVEDDLSEDDSSDDNEESFCNPVSKVLFCVYDFHFTLYPIWSTADECIDFCFLTGQCER
jgi:hypothetical protein